MVQPRRGWTKKEALDWLAPATAISQFTRTGHFALRRIGPMRREIREDSLEEFIYSPSGYLPVPNPLFFLPLIDNESVMCFCATLCDASLLFHSLGASLQKGDKDTILTFSCIP